MSKTILPGEHYSTGEGRTFEILYHFTTGKYPVAAKDIKSGDLVSFTHEGKFMVGVDSAKDLILG